MIADQLDLLFGLTENIWSKQLAFYGLGPVERGAALTSIQGFKGCHLQTNLIAFVVRKLGKGQTVLPFGSIRKKTSVEHILEYRVHSLSLTSRMWVIGSAGRELCSQSFM
jgi:hypothetical protein